MTDTTERQNLDHGIDADDETRAIDAEPSVDTLLGDLERMLGGQGWGDVDTSGAALQKQRTQQMRQLKAQANIFRDTFMTPAGRKCLELMLDQTLRAGPYPYDQNLPRDVIETMVIVHDAQCNFVRAILSAIAQAENREATRSVT
jgi:hypothetical protein